MSTKTNETSNESIRGLVDNAGFVLDHPFLLKIVEKAPSPKAADDYIIELGWPNDIARKVRAAVKLKQKFPNLWNDLLKNETKPSLFNWISYLGDRRCAVPAIEILHGTEKTSLSGWPYFLREMVFPGDSKERVDTFYLNNTPNDKLVISDLITEDVTSIKSLWVHSPDAFCIASATHGNCEIALSKNKSLRSKARSDLLFKRSLYLLCYTFNSIKYLFV